MIKRQDLVKQFELVVKQEIINHNRAISENNIKFNDIHKEIESLKEVGSKNNDRIVAKLNTLSSQFLDSIKFYKELGFEPLSTHFVLWNNNKNNKP